MLSICGCTKKRVGALVAPNAEAVTWAVPVAAGVPIEYSGAFQVPAHAPPLGATSRIPGLLEAKVKVGVIFAFVPFCAAAVSCRIEPTCMEKLEAGVRVIFAGKGEAPGGL